MKGLLLKDIYSLKGNFKQYGIMVAFFTIMSVVMKNEVFITMVVAIFCGLVISAFYYEETCQWNKYALCTPLNPKQIIGEKYLLMLLVDLVGVIYSLAGGMLFILTNSGEGGFSYTSFIVAVSAVVIFMNFIYLILIPYTVKYGTEKSRIIMVALFLVPTIGIVLLGKVIQPFMGTARWQGIMRFLDQQFPLLVAGVIVFLIVSMILSFIVAVRIMEKKEY